MDVVYILGNGSRAGNEEIKFSVRSLVKHMQDLGKIFVVGDVPVCLPGVVHIEAPDDMEKFWQNAYLKTALACKDERISEEFLLMNDDFFAVKDFLGADLPFYAVKGSNGGTSGMHDFAPHVPIRIKKEMYLKMPFDVYSKGMLSPRSFYGNFYRAPASFISDPILRVGSPVKPYDQQVAKHDFFSTDDVAWLDNGFLLWVENRYATPSVYED